MTAARWLPGGFERWITLAASLVLFYSMTSRGADYATGDYGDTARRLSTLEAAAPLWGWGALFLVGAGLGFSALLVGRPVLLMWAHGIGAACYTALAVGLLTDVIERAGAPLSWTLVLAGVAAAAFIVGPIAGRVAAEGRYTPIIVWTAAASAATGALTIPLDGLRNATVFVCIATLHTLMMLGTAGRVRRDKLREERAHD